jgi:hypothetical protein
MPAHRPSPALFQRLARIKGNPTLTTSLNYFGPVAYAPTQHGPLLTIIGSHASDNCL